MNTAGIIAALLTVTVTFDTKPPSPMSKDPVVTVQGAPKVTAVVVGNFGK